MSDTYCDVGQVASQLGIPDSDEDVLLAAAVDAASRQVDSYCGRRFWQDSAVVAREFFPTSSTCVDLLGQPDGSPATEISTATGLIVKTDSGDNGGFATTLTIGTHFLLHPRDAAADGRPYSAVG